MSQTSDLLPMIQAVLTAHPEGVERYRAGKTHVFGFWMGQIMQKPQDEDHPKKVHDLMVDQLKSALSPSLLHFSSPSLGVDPDVVLRSRPSCLSFR